ncbi:MAG TPA: ABC transporter permease [Candidatus Micrarchaeota archaeon]|nr:ABC transporter permease [Candidatus Micrarchaeota archaeon]
MKLLDTISLSFNTLTHRKLRSWLAILGIIVGVASIVSLISISLGLSAQINSRLNTLGTNIITLSPGGQGSSRTGIGGVGILGMRRPGGEGQFAGAQSPGGGTSNTGGTGKITFSEADSLRNVDGVQYLNAQVESRVTVAYKDQNSSVSIIGTEPDAFPTTSGATLLHGRFLTSNDQYSALLGFNVANRTFNDLDMTNRQITIAGKTFKVVGILNSSGTSGFGSIDGNIYIPQKIAKTLFNQTTDVSAITIAVDPNYDTDTVAQSIRDTMDALHRVTSTTEDFTVQTAATMQATLSSITEMLTLFLGGIASISLIVGGIGVANTMFMSVLEQTKYIGLLKSLGTRNKDILMLFMCEAGIIGFVGGAIGVLLSFGVSYALTSLGLPSMLTLPLVVGGLTFSVIVGLVSGVVPARNAAALEPIEALRYE